MKFNKAYKKIEKNQTLSVLLPFIVPIFQTGLESEKKYKKTDIDFLERIIDILDSIEQIYMLIDFLAQEKQGEQSHVKYSVYLIEDILFRFTCIFDKCLHLSSIICGMSISLKEYEEHLIGADRLTHKGQIKTALVELNRFTHEFRLKRKRIACSGCFSETELERIQSLFVLFKDSHELHGDRLSKYRKNFISYLAEKEEMFRSNTLRLEKLVDNFFITFIPELQVFILKKYDVNPSEKYHRDSP
jgi:hypothetical protein